MLSRRGVVKTIFIAISLIFMMVFVWRNAKQAEGFPLQPDFSSLSYSLLAAWLGFVSVILIWKFLIGSYGESISSGQAYRIYFHSNLGKYLPGKVWQLAGMVYLCSEIGVPPAKSIPASLYNQGIAVFTGLAFFIICMHHELAGFESLYFWVALIAAVMLLFLIYPDFLTMILNVALRLLGKQEIKAGIGRGVLLVTVILYMLAWSIFGWGFLLFLHFLGISGEENIWSATGLLSGSVSLGFLAFFSPGGIGIREGVMVYFLEKHHPLSVALFVSIAARLWLTTVELLGFTSTFIPHTYKRRGMSDHRAGMKR